MSIVTIDTGYVMPQFAAAYLVREGARAAFVETNTTHSVPRLLDALHAEGLTPDSVDYVIVTHVHLDHAGGASALMKACPRATLLAHPRAAKHLIDPEKLVKSARQVYGEENFRRLYGEILPIPAARVRIMEDESTIAFGSRTLHFLHTRGHANHHFCIYDSGSNGIFTGDAFGLAYPALQSPGRFAFPSTSPTDFDAKEAIAALDRIVGTGAETAYLTHFGPVKHLETAAHQLKEVLTYSGELVEQAVAAPLPDANLDDFCHRELLAFVGVWLPRATGRELDETVMKWLEMDLLLNAQGIAHVARKRRIALLAQ